jgi:putative ABC transport system permease protein
MSKGMSFSKLRESLITGIKEIIYHKTRSFLTLTGIVLGVTSLIAMISITDGYRKNFTEFMNAWGGLARISIENVDGDTLAELKREYNAKGITVEDITLIKENNSDIIKHIVPQKQRGRFVVKYGNRSMHLHGNSVIGTSAGFADIEKLVIEDGRNIVEFDDIIKSRVCVIGSIIKDELFGETGLPVGEKLSINGRYLTIVGTFEKYLTESEREKIRLTQKRSDRRLAINTQNEVEHITGRALWRKYGRIDPFFRKNMNVIVPLSTFEILFDPSEGLSTIQIEFKDSERIEEYIERIKTSLRSNRPGYEDFSINTSTELFEQTQKQMQTMSLVFGAIALISLFVGGIGIMNVILASISERIREIGVRKSVGARNMDIFVQFLIETVVLSVMGGFIGVIAGMGVSSLISKLADMATVISPFAIILAVTSSFLIGIIFGIYPSLKAAKLNPIDALRYE